MDVDRAAPTAIPGISASPAVPMSVASDKSLLVLWLRTLSYLRPYRLQCLIVSVSILLTIAFNLALFFGVKVMIDNAIAHRAEAELLPILAGLALLYVVSALAGLGQDYVSADVETRVGTDIRLRLLGHLQRLSTDYFLHNSVGEHVTTFSEDVHVVEEALTETLSTLVQRSIQLVASLVFLVFLNWPLALLTMIALPLTLVIPRYLVSKRLQLTAIEHDADVAVVRAVKEYIDGQVVVSAFGMQEELLTSFRRLLDRLRATSLPVGRLTRLTHTTGSFGVSLGLFLVTAGGVILVYNNRLSVGTLVGFVGTLGILGDASLGLAEAIPSWISSSESMARIEEVLSEQPAIEDMPDAIELPRVQGGIRFDHVSFGYHAAHYNLRNATFDIEPKRSVAVVGRSGAGKSTVLELMLRFYDPDEGEVVVDNWDLRKVTQRSLRAQFGVVFQETFLFNTSVRENIRLGRPNATDEEIEAAARAAQVHDDIVALPEGYRTVVGERGGQLSGGQRQRVALARALVRDPAILLLDEATSSLDPATETAFIETLEGLARNRTVVSITHRVASVRDVDRILVMHDGQLVEQGTHEQLLAQQGTYRRLWDQQAGFIISGDGMSARVTSQRLRHIPLFAAAPEPVLAALAERFVVHRYEPGSAIVEQGQEGNTFYILVRGSVEVVRTDDQGEAKRYAVLQDGDFFGEISLLRQEPRTATVRALTPCLVLALTRQSFESLVSSLPELRDSMEEVATRRLRELGLGPPES